MGLPNSSRETKFSGANGDREIIIFVVQLTTSRIGNLTRLILTLAIIRDDGHTYILLHTHIPSVLYYVVKYLSLKAAVNTIVPRSPFFSFRTSKYRALQT